MAKPDKTEPPDPAADPVKRGFDVAEKIVAGLFDPTLILGACGILTSGMLGYLALLPPEQRADAVTFDALAAGILSAAGGSLLAAGGWLLLLVVVIAGVPVLFWQHRRIRMLSMERSATRDKQLTDRTSSDAELAEMGQQRKKKLEQVRKPRNKDRQGS